DGCLGDPFTVTVQVDPEPVGNTIPVTPICSDVVMGAGFTLTTTGGSAAVNAANGYNITAITIPGGVTASAGAPAVANGQSSTVLTDDAWNNIGSASANVVYTIVPVSSGAGCLGNPFTVTVQVDPEPVGIVIPLTPVCSDVALGAGFTLGTTGTSAAVNAANGYNIVSISVPAGVTASAGLPVVANGQSSTILIDDAWNNVSSASANVVYTIVPVASGTNCLGDPFTVTVQVDPEPVGITIPATPVCSDLVIGAGFTLSTTGTSAAVNAANGYNITAISIPAGITASAGAPAVANGQSSTVLTDDAWNNPGSASANVVYTIVPVSSGAGCLGNPFTVTVQVNPEPVLFNPGFPDVCSSNSGISNPVNIVLGTNGTSATAASYQIVNIQYDDGGGFNVALPANFSRLPGANAIGTSGDINWIKNDKYNNTRNASVIVRYTIQGSSSQGCLSELLDYDVVVNPEPILLVPVPAPVCSDVITSITLQETAGSAVATTFNINNIIRQAGLVAGGSNASIGLGQNNMAIFNDTFTNTTASNLTVTYKIAPVTALGCVGVQQDLVLTIQPAPAVASLNKAVCSTEATGIIFSATGSSAPVAVPFGFNILGVVIQAGLTQTAGGTGVRMAVTSTEIQNDRFTNPGNTPLTVTYTIQGITSAGCTGPTSDVILTVEPTITAVPVNNSANICSATQTDIDLTSPTLPTSGTITFNYIAVSSVGGQMTGFVPAISNLPLNYKITDNLVNNSDNVATLTYTITPDANGAKSGAGCIGASVPVVVNVEPKPKLTASPLVQTICESDGVNVSPTNILLTSTTVPSVGTLEFNQISAVATGGLTLLSPLKTTYLNGESIADQWDNPTLMDQTVTYTLRPEVSGGLGCPGDDVIVTVTIKPRPIISPVAPQSVCSGEFRSISLVTDIPGTFATWSVSAPGTITGALNGGGNNLDITLFNSGFNVETVTYTVTPKFNNCDGIPMDIVVTVNPTPNTVGLPATITVCDGATLDVPLSSGVAGTTFDWVVTDVFNLEAPGFFDGNGTTINQVVNNPNGFQAVLIYQVTPTSPDGCVGLPRIMNVNVGSIVASITPDQTEICSGRRIQMTNSSLGATSHRWFYRVQGTTTEIDVRTTPFVNYQLDNTTTTNPLVYEIVYQPSNGLCTVPEVVTPITVYRNVIAGFDEGIVPPIIGGTSVVNFTNTSNPNDGTQFRYEWDFGSSSFASPATFVGATPPPVVYSQQGPYQVTVKAINIAAETAGLQCESTFFKTIVVPVLPLIADFTLDPPAGCFPTVVNVIENLSTGDIMEWQVVDSNGKVVAVSGLDLPEFFIATPGLFNVQLTTRDSFTDAIEFANANFEVYDIPIASFQARPTTVFVPDTEMTTFNFSTGADFYQWDFGDGETSEDREPKHTYKIEGVYDIVMVAGFDHGGGIVCTDTLTQQVVAKQGGQTKIPNAFTPNPGGPSGGVTGGGGGGTFNDVFLPIVKGVEEFNMQIFDRWGNLIFESNSSNMGWDGYDKNGNILPAGVYIYKLTLRLSDGQRTTQLGDITMIR
ncbi:MAG: PKD-like domain-containing protein, partial [Cyclobacteriaceae bacterium]